MHLAMGSDIFESFLQYQRRLIGEYDRLAEEWGFVTVDARRSIEEIQGDLRSHIADYLHRGRREADAANGPVVPIGRDSQKT